MSGRDRIVLHARRVRARGRTRTGWSVGAVGHADRLSAGGSVDLQVGGERASRERPPLVVDEFPAQIGAALDGPHGPV